MAKENLHLLCEWCGWEGREDELDKNEHDEPAHCPYCGHGSFSTVNIDKNEIHRCHCRKFDKRNTLKKFLVVLSFEKKIPEEGWDVAFERIRLQVYAVSKKAAKDLALGAMKFHNLYCKVVYIREMKPETK